MITPVQIANGQKGKNVSRRMMESDGELSLFDLADWLWSFKWLGVFLLVLGIAVSVMLWRTPQTSSASYEVTFSIYRSGTAIRGADQIADILGTRLSAPDISLVSSRGDNPVVISTNIASLADDIVEQANSVETLLIDEVVAWRQKIEPLINDNPSAFAEFARANAFVAGVDSQLIDLIQPNVQTVQTLSRGPLWQLPILGSIAAFFAIAGGMTFIRGWKRHRERLKSD